MIVSICLGGYNRIPDWRAYKQQKFVSHSSGDQEVQDQGQHCWVRALFLVPSQHLFTVPSGGRRAGERCGVSFIGTLMPFLKTPSSCSS